VSLDWGQWNARPDVEQDSELASDREADEEAELWRSYKEANDKDARDRLILKYYGFVKSVAGRLAKTLPASVAFNDLASYGLLGLADAIDRFEPERGYRFSTFAGPRIRGAILDGLRADDWVPRTIRRRSRALGDAEARLTSSLGRVPTDEEIASEVGLSLKELGQLRVEVSATRVERLDDRTGYRDTVRALETHGELIAAESQGPELLDDVATRTRILVSAIKVLPNRTKLIVALYYYERMSFSQIGAVLGISESRVSRILSAGIAAMRQKVYQEDLDGMAG